MRLGKPVVAWCTATAIPFIYSFSGNCAASATISTFMCLWASYIFPGAVHIRVFPPAEKADPSWGYVLVHVIRSQIHECGNWDWGPDIPFLGIIVSNFRHFVFAVCRGSQARWRKEIAEPAILNVYGAPELIPRNEFRQPMWPGGPVRLPYSSSVPSPHRLFPTQVEGIAAVGEGYRSQSRPKQSEPKNSSNRKMSKVPQSSDP